MVKCLPTMWETWVQSLGQDDPLENSSRVATRVSWSPLSGLKGVQPPLPFGAMKVQSEVKALSRVQPSATLWTAAYQGSSIHGILQVGILEWVAISFSSRSSQPRD